MAVIRSLVIAVLPQLLLSTAPILVGAVPLEDAGILNIRNDVRARDPFEYKGCFGTHFEWETDPDAYGLRTGLVSDSVTPTLCATTCGTRHFALWDKKCLCLDTVVDDVLIESEYIPVLDSWRATLGDCWRICTADGSSACGGSMRFSVYGPPDPPPPEPGLVGQVDGWTYEGCWTDNPGQRVLDGGYSGERMSPTACSQFCSTSLYFGLQFGRECWCGPVLAPTSTQVAESECNMRCRMNRALFCGDADRLTLYKRVGAGDPGTVIPGYTSLGCYTDNVGGRALPHLSGPTYYLTIQQCADLATAGGYKYFGVEFGNECWLGNTLNPSSTPAAPATCNKGCTGNPSQICGGPDRINLYTVTAPDPEPSTCTRVASPSTDTLACHIRGFAAPTSGIGAPSTKDTIADCAGICSSTSGCVSYAYNADSKACSLYTTGVWASVGDIAPQAGGQYRDTFLDDIGCWTCQ